MTAISVSERLLEMAAFYTPLALTVTLSQCFSSIFLINAESSMAAAPKSK